jgi:hypothetical protein
VSDRTINRARKATATNDAVGKAGAVTNDEVVEELAQARARISALERQQKAAPSDANDATLKARIVELEHKLALAQMARGKVPESAAEMAAMKRAADEVRAAERAAAKAARQAKAPSPEPGETLVSLAEKLRQSEQRLKAARTRIRNITAELNDQRDWIRGDGARTGMPFKLVAAISNALHPDRGKVAEAERARERDAALKAFNAWKAESRKHR